MTTPPAPQAAKSDLDFDPLPVTVSGVGEKQPQVPFEEQVDIAAITQKVILDRYKNASSESEKYTHLTARFCNGAGVDIASQGAPVVPWAISFDLPEAQFLKYSAGNPPKGPIHLRGDARNLPFETASLDFVYSSHLLEDFDNWIEPLAEWCRCVRIGGNLIILMPDKVLWDRAIANGQLPNCSHKKEGQVGALTEIFKNVFGHFEVLEDRLTAVTPEDYSILFVARRVR